MKRRKFISVLSGVSLASLGGYMIYPSFEEITRNIIYQATKGLHIQEEQINQFLTQATQERYWKQFNLIKKEFIKAHCLTESSPFQLPYFSKYRQYKNKIIGQFLLSTDFFNFNMRADRKINYTGFYNPYKLPCGSPFPNI